MKADRQDAIAQATKDIHQRCPVEIDLLWDEGKSHGDDGTHQIKVWNGLGSVHRSIRHRDLVERGAEYRQFVDDLAEAVRRRLTVQA